MDRQKKSDCNISRENCRRNKKKTECGETGMRERLKEKRHREKLG